MILTFFFYYFYFYFLNRFFIISYQNIVFEFGFNQGSYFMSYMLVLMESFIFPGNFDTFEISSQL